MKMDTINMCQICKTLFLLENREPGQRIETLDQSLDNREVIYNKL